MGFRLSALGPHAWGAASALHLWGGAFALHLWGRASALHLWLWASALRPRCASLALALVVASGCTRADPAAEHAALVQRGHDVFFTRCAPCHGPQGDWPMVKRLKDRKAADFYALFDHLPSVNPIMPPFDAPDADRRAVAAFLETLRPDSWDEPGAHRAAPPPATP